MFIHLFIAAWAAINKCYGSPPEVGEPARPGSFCKQNSLPCLPSRPRCASDSSVTLRVTWGASRDLRPSLCEPLRGRARRFRHSPLGARLRAVLGLHLTVQQKHLARPLIGAGRRGVAPNELLPDQSPYGLRLVHQNSSAPPPGATAWTGAGAPTSPSPAASPLRSQLAAGDAKAAPPPPMRKLGGHIQT